MSKTTQAPIAERVEQLDWADLRHRLDSDGFAVTPPLLSGAECDDLAHLFNDEQRFRSTVDMARHRFGDGRYRYFEHPLPDPIGPLRSAFYDQLAPIANAWWQLTQQRPQRGARGYHRVMRHGVSTITRGSRTALGIIFHDAT